MAKLGQTWVNLAFRTSIQDLTCETGLNGDGLIQGPGFTEFDRYVTQPKDSNC